jgi:4a-hydroxytetrahydrobiopterin dehydratase
MDDLAEKKCVSCEGGLPPLDYKEIHNYLKKVNGWEVKKNEKNIFFIQKKFTFKDFIKSQNFVNLVSDISESEGHHPDITFGWGYANIQITTHAVEGLSENDFILASKIDNKANV